MIERRILPRDVIGPAMRATPSKDPHRTCRATIRLDGTRYRCGRETSGIDSDRGLGVHEGIHDAFAVHGDLGTVRW